MSSKPESKQALPEASVFDDLLKGNSKFVQGFDFPHMDGYAHRGLAIVTCMDSRIDPLRVVGIGPGDAKILRNAGARVTYDVLRTLVLACHLLGVTRVLVMPHTDCRMAKNSEEQIREQIAQSSGLDTSEVEFQTAQDQIGALLDDIASLRAHPLLPPELAVMGAMYDVHSGRLTPISAQS